MDYKAKIRMVQEALNEANRICTHELDGPRPLGSVEAEAQMATLLVLVELLDCMKSVSEKLGAVKEAM
jgi:hypothetical protein